MVEYKVENHVSSFLPEGRKWSLVWSDEFDGEKLDMTKWSFRHHLFHNEHKTFVEDAAKLDGKGNIVFNIVEKDGKYYSSQLQTGENFMDRPSSHSDWPIAPISKPKFMHKYGYYEVRCKMQQKDVWWSAFWLQSPIIGSTLNPKISGVEVDIMESFTPNQIVPHFLHWNGYGEDHEFENTMGEKRYADEKDNIKLKETDDGYHTFAVHWEKDGYTFYVDGKQSGPKLNEAVSDMEQFILIGTECKGWRREIPGFAANVSDKDVVTHDSFTVDYVRVFDEVK